MVFGLPSLRLRGFYLAVSTLAAQFFVQWALTKFGWFSNDSAVGRDLGAAARDRRRRLRRRRSAAISSRSRSSSLLTALALAAGERRRSARNLIAVRDNETAARVIGVPVLRTKLLAFAISLVRSSASPACSGPSPTCGRSSRAGFNLDRSFQILFIIIIGGLASIRGAFLGAAFIVRAAAAAVPNLAATLFGGAVDSGTLEIVQRILLGVLIILFLIVEPEGLSAVIERLGRLRLRPHGRPARPTTENQS